MRGRSPNRSGAVLLAAVLVATGCGRQNEAAEDDAPGARAGDAQPATATDIPRDPNRLYCQEHSAYEDECFICHPELRENGRLWCQGHGRYEDRCFLCHPELEDPNRQLCGKHYLFEDECFLCRPELKAGGEPAADAGPPARLMCNEHGVFEDECGICHPELLAGLPGDPSLKVRFASSDAAAKAGLRTETPQSLALGAGVDCYAEIEFDQNRLAEIVTQVDGIIHAVEADLGDRVAEGDILATIRSAAIGGAVAKVRLARQTLERERKLRADRITSEQDLQEAEAAYQAAYETVRILGFEDERIEALCQRSAEPALLPLRAPFSGEIVERNAVRGARVEAGLSLFRLADRSRVWAMLNIPEKHLAKVRTGQEVELQVDALPGRTFHGTLTWIAAQVDDRTRMARARVEVSNDDRALRARMFARAHIRTAGEEPSLVLPHGAVQRVDGRPLVFVKLADDLYEARPVRLGADRDGSTVVVEGLSPEDDVVTENGYIAKSQLLLSRLGAGCVHE